VLFEAIDAPNIYICAYMHLRQKPFIYALEIKNLSVFTGG